MTNPHTLRFADLPKGKATEFHIEPDPTLIDDLRASLDLLGLRKLRFSGTVAPVGRADWRLKGKLGATVVQPCVVTLQPVTTRIEEPIERLYMAEMEEPEGAGEFEMPEDETREPLPATLNLLDVMSEVLALALPAWPRADDAALDQTAFTEPGKAPMTDEDARPFAGLASLKDKLEKDGK